MLKLIPKKLAFSLFRKKFRKKQVFMSAFPKAIILGLAVLTLNGCATVMEGNDQSIVISTVKCEEHGDPICTASNKDNAVMVRAPGTIPVEKGKSDLIVTCRSDDGLARGTFNASSTYEAMNLGNILLGGFIGLGVDAATGAMWEFPSGIIVEMICFPPNT